MDEKKRVYLCYARATSRHNWRLQFYAEGIDRLVLLRAALKRDAPNWEVGTKLVYVSKFESLPDNVRGGFEVVSSMLNDITNTP